jgi:hypothetical protein
VLGAEHLVDLPRRVILAADHHGFGYALVRESLSRTPVNESPGSSSAVADERTANASWPLQLRRAKIGVSGVVSGRDRVRRGAALEKLPYGGGGPLQGGGIMGLRTRRPRR